jgi:hypothetical protein
LRNQAERTNDVAYAAARLIGIAGIAHVHTPGNLVWKTPNDIGAAIQARNDQTLETYSHGDAGGVLINAADFA